MQTLRRILENAVEGDYVVSDNGWVVPLIRKTYLEDKRTRGGKKRYRPESGFQVCGVSLPER
jgi:hypothetical protein